MNAQTAPTRYVALAAVTALALLPTSAVGASETSGETRERARTTVRFTEVNPGMDGVLVRGTVDSPAVACEKGRTVRLRTADGRLLGRDEADEFGRWVFRLPLTDAASGSFEAIARRDRVRSGRIVCGRGSDTALVGVT